MPAVASRIMYIERKAGALEGEARIGRVTFSRSGRTLYYRGHRFQRLTPCGYKRNYLEVESGEEYWISGCKKDGGDRLYEQRGMTEIDADIREEYWVDIRGMPDRRIDGVT